MHFWEWKVLYLDLKKSLKFVPKGPIDNYPALVQIMAWRRIGDKSLAIISTNADRIPWRIYAALGGDELNFILIVFVPKLVDHFNSLRPSDAWWTIINK